MRTLSVFTILRSDDTHISEFISDVWSLKDGLKVLRYDLSGKLVTEENSILAFTNDLAKGLNGQFFVEPSNRFTVFGYNGKKFLTDSPIEVVNLIHDQNNDCSGYGAIAVLEWVNNRIDIIIGEENAVIDHLT